MMEQFVCVLGVLVCLTFSATAAHAQPLPPQGSGQGERTLDQKIIPAYITRT